jgi:dTDP-4-amino-4,6-dideoxygalactose transaminase
LNLQPAFASLGKPAGSFPIAERLTQREILSLPMYPHIAEEQVDYVCRQIREYVISKLRKTGVCAP